METACNDASRTAGPVAPEQGHAVREKVGSRVTIYKTSASPNWYMDFCVDGKQFRPSLRTHSKKQAITLARKMDAELVLGVADCTGKRGPRIREAVDDHLKNVERRGKQPGTLKVYRNDLNDFEAYATWRGVSRLDRVTAKLLEDYEDRLKTKGLDGVIKPSKGRRKRKPNQTGTIHVKLKVVRQLIKWAVRRGLLKEDPARGYELPPRSRARAHCWTPQELTALREHAPKGCLDVFDFFRLTGLRADELCWLTKEDIDFDRPHVKVRAKTCAQTSRSWRPKHGNERVVPLCPEALSIARRAYEASTGPWLFWAERTRTDQPGHHTPAKLRLAVKRAMAKGGVTKGTTHTFRHVFCSFMANSNVPPLIVMKIMGHSSLDIILTYYHLSDQELLGAFDAVSFGAMLCPAEKAKPVAGPPAPQN